MAGSPRLFGDLAPVDLQLVLDDLDAIDTANEFLSHLLLIKRAHSALQTDVTVAGFHLDFVRREIGARD